jgi:ATPase family associated with various cellular activities (AAA)
MSRLDEQLSDEVLRVIASSFGAEGPTFSCSIDVPVAVAVASQVGPDAIIEREICGPNRTLTVVHRTDGTVVIDRDHRVAQVTVLARTQPAMERMASEVRAARDSRPADSLPVRVWRRVRFSDFACRREFVRATPWSDIGRNYPPDVRDAFDRLRCTTALPGSSRIVVFYGPPGTGKTTAVRSLITQWSPWMTVEDVIDAPSVFSWEDNLDRIATALEDDSATSSAEARPKLIIAEDCDGMLKGEGVLSGPLGQLLGFTDGLTIHKIPSLVVLTTNLARHELPPALLRPGRCLSMIEFTTFSITEARRWLDDPSAEFPDGEPTLAELLHRSGVLHRDQTADHSRYPMSGLYI